MSQTPANAITRRTERLVVRDLGDETLLYDLDTNEVHHLAGEAARVWRALGTGGEARVAAVAEMDRTTAAIIIQELAQKKLLASTGTGISRRTVLRGAVLGAGTIAALPFVETIAAPLALASCSLPPVLGTSVTQFFLDQPPSGNGTNPSSGFTAVFKNNSTASPFTSAPGAFTNSSYSATPTRRFSNNTATVSQDATVATSTNVTLTATSGAGFFYTVPGSTSESVSFTYSIKNTGTTNVTYYVGTSGTGVTLTPGSTATNTVPVSGGTCLTSGTKIYLYFTAAAAASVQITDFTVKSTTT